MKSETEKNNKVILYTTIYNVPKLDQISQVMHLCLCRTGKTRKHDYALDYKHNESVMAMG
jgi:hypothetical protein